jgi:hypothetical protein
MSSKSGSNKAQKTHHEGGGGGGGSAASTTPLVKALLKEKGILRKIVEITSVSQTLRLIMSCKELLAAEKDVFENHKLPVVCDMTRGCNKLFRAMVGTPNSRWVKWLDTLAVEELKLPTSVTDEEMLIMFDAAGGLSFDGGGGGGGRGRGGGKGGGGGGEEGEEGEGDEGGKRFSKLRTLHLWSCFNITDASVLEVARRCSSLQSFSAPGNITDASVMEVARRCSNLQTLNLTSCWNITDTSVLEVARRCSNLQTLNLDNNRNITDASVLEVARRCSNLQTLDLFDCRNITSACKNALRQSHPMLQLRG